MIKILSSLDLREGETLSLTVDHQALIAVRAGNRAYVYLNNCPHLALKLNQGQQQCLDRSHRYLQCTNHGALFEIHNGLCVNGPCVGARLQKIGTQEFDGAIWFND